MGGPYDAIVIGAGIGGLTAAACLAREGLRVLVLEQDPHPGGTAYTFIRRGFQFPMGPLGFSSPGLVKKAWEEFTGERLELKRVDYLLHAFGLEVVISHPYPRLEEELSALFPDDMEGIRAFFDLVRNRTGSEETGRLLEASAAEYLHGSIEDDRLRRILGSQGTGRPYSSLALLAAMWELMCAEGIHYPGGGFRRFCDSLAAAVNSRSSGGDVRLRTEVARILVDSGKVAGVLLDDGSMIAADAVVSNADFKTTFLELLAPEQVPLEWREAVYYARQTSSNLQVALGVEVSRVDLSAFKRASRIIYRRESGASRAVPDVPDWDANEVEPDALAGQELELCLLSAEDEGLAPPGSAVVVIRTGAPHKHFVRFRPDRGARTPDYAGYKERLGAALVGEASAVLPGLAGAVGVVDVATPLTFEDRGRRSGGAVAGWSWDYGDGGSRRWRVGKELVRTPLAGLFMAGYQAFSSLSMGGVPTAIRSGQLAARAVLDGAPPVTEVNIPGSSLD